MLWLSLALVVLGALAYDLARKWIALHQPVPPHEELAAQVRALRHDVDAIKAYAQMESR